MVSAGYSNDECSVVMISAVCNDECSVVVMNAVFSNDECSNDKNVKYLGIKVTRILSNLISIIDQIAPGEGQK